MEQEVTEVWPENWAAFSLFARLRTQWHIGLNGPSGLRYEAVYPLMDRAAASPEEWELLFDDLQTMEEAAMAAMRDE